MMMMTYSLMRANFLAIILMETSLHHLRRPFRSHPYRFGGVLLRAGNMRLLP